MFHLPFIKILGYLSTGNSNLMPILKNILGTFNLFIILRAIWRCKSSLAYLCVSNELSLEPGLHKKWEDTTFLIRAWFTFCQGICAQLDSYYIFHMQSCLQICCMGNYSIEPWSEMWPPFTPYNFEALGADTTKLVIVIVYLMWNLAWLCDIVAAETG